MTNITYEKVGIDIRVRLEGRSVGVITPVGGGYAYKPNGFAGTGDTMPTANDVKRTLEED